MSDEQNKEQLLKLMRYNATFTSSMVSLDDYTKHMKEGQSAKIYFITSVSKEQALKSPFMEVFKGSDVPVLILTNNVDEICLKQVGAYKGFTFVNVETSFEQLSQDLKGANNSDHDSVNPASVSVPEEDITSYSLWLKQELAPYVGRVTISRRLKTAPAVLFGEMSSTMRMMMQMMNQSGGPSDDQYKNTLEINAAHPLISKLNLLRKKD
jgi:HSP90 family molecular chaperone